MADEEDFNRLPPSVAAKIDYAFDQALASDEHSDERLEVTGTEDFGAGGFIIEDESGPSTSNTGLNLPLRLIPTALDLLGLPPDDQEVLDVLHNAAGGWGSGNSKEQGVSRRDWRAVCAVLMPTTDGMTDKSYPYSDQALLRSEDEEMDNFDEGDADSGDEYHSQSDHDDDEYTGSPQKQPSASRISIRRKKHSSPVPENDSPTTLSARQKKEVKRIFALFFPGTPTADVEGKRLKIKDVANAAALLKEKLTADDVSALYAMYP